MSTQVMPEIRLAARPLLMPWQWGWLVFQMVLLAAVAAFSYTSNPDNFPLLWSDPMGVKMLLAAAVFLVTNLAVFVGGSQLVNRIEQRTRHGVLSLVLAVTSFVLLYLPVLFVVLTGPSAIAIQRNLSM